MVMEKSSESTLDATDPKKSGALKKQRICQIHLFNGQEFRCDVLKQAEGTVLLQEIYKQLNIIEFDYFGLYFKDLSDQKYWLEPNKSIKKQVKTGPWSFYFAVKFYPPDPAQLQEDITRYYMVAQLREDIVTGRLPCSFVTHALLGSFIVQSELGDYNRTEMKGDYIKNFTFAPNQTPELEERVKELHKTYRGQTPEQAERNFLENAKKLPLYGVDLHLSQDSDGINLLVGISWNGVLVYRDGTLINRFAWPRVIKLSYIRSKFYITIRPLDGDDRLNMVGFKMPNHGAAKNVWKSGVEHHTFFRLVRSEPSPRTRMVRIGSKFRYSGRTQRETRIAVASSEQRPPPTVLRTPSRKVQPNGSEAFSTRKVLLTVEEESNSESKLQQPQKTDDQTIVVQETITMTTVVESVEGSPKKEEILKDEDHEDNKLGMTDHQMTIHKMKTKNQQNESVEFLASSTPATASSVDSLDVLDARLTPRRLNETTTPERNEVKTPKAMPECEEVETVSTVTYEVITNGAGDANSSSSQSDHEDEEVESECHRKSSSSDSNSSVSSEENMEEKKEIPKIDHELSSSSSSENEDNLEPTNILRKDHVPELIVTSSIEPPEESSHNDVESSSDEDVPEVLTLTKDSVNIATVETRYVRVKEVMIPPEEDNGLESSDDLKKNIGITTVETRRMRVEDVVIPQEENEIHQLSLITDGEDGLTISRADQISITSTSSSSSHEAVENSPLYQEPPIVKTEAVVVDSYFEETPERTTIPPMVQTELKTITYEQNNPIVMTQECSIVPELVSSQIISSETEHTVTTTEITKVMHGDVSETRVEKQVVTTGGCGADHTKAMMDMLRDTQRCNPNINITKVVVHEERPVLNGDHL